MSWVIHHGDWIERLREMSAESAHCVVTSPPYWGLRDYGVPGQLGLERTPEEYIAKMVEGFREVRRVLRKDGTLWLNLGDCYNQGNKGNSGELKPSHKQASNHGSLSTRRGPMLGSNRNRKHEGMKPKDLVGMPWALALALRADGWWLRCDIIWSKSNQFPESVEDRPTRAHEYIFLLTKRQHYFYDAEAIKEPLAAPEKNGRSHTVSLRYSEESGRAGDSGLTNLEPLENRNKRSVWEIPTSPFPEAHFATFPPKLVEPCILAGCPEGGTVLDPFTGAGTTGLVALRYHRNFIGIELKADYVAMAKRRIEQDAPLFNLVNA